MQRLLAGPQFLRQALDTWKISLPLGNQFDGREGKRGVGEREVLDSVLNLQTPADGLIGPGETNKPHN